jgi:hypothetical protein
MRVASLDGRLALVREGIAVDVELASQGWSDRTSGDLRQTDPLPRMGSEPRQRRATDPTCSINGNEVQIGRTSDLPFLVSALIEKLSHVMPPVPGNVIFTGTRSGAGTARTRQALPGAR